MSRPDEGRSDRCRQCNAVLCRGGVKWYGTGSTGPYCSVVCLRDVGDEGDLPDYVEEFPGMRAVFPADLCNQLVTVEPMEETSDGSR